MRMEKVIPNQKWKLSLILLCSRRALEEEHDPFQLFPTFLQPFHAWDKAQTGPHQIEE
ncbi:hypothetical protein BGX38DRAFT_1278256 [Terfezia claveryi]|nr:hypothetical protein BGX38DRAFT_1278256 [Terfezia claveryi]